MSLDGLLGSISNPQSLNRYAYVLGNPVTNIDPNGRSAYKVRRWFGAQKYAIGQAFKRVPAAHDRVSKATSQTIMVELPKHMKNTTLKFADEAKKQNAYVAGHYRDGEITRLRAASTMMLTPFVAGSKAIDPLTHSEIVVDNGILN